VIGQNASDNSRYPEAVALFQLLPPSACNNTFFGSKFGQKKGIIARCSYQAPARFTVCQKARENSIFLKKRKQDVFAFFISF
jgi:hypothetical protein